MQLTRFQEAYIECALWSSTDENGVPLDQHHDAGDIDSDTLTQMKVDCEDFTESNRSLLADLDDAQSGHDFWLTRNRHGAGFWDRGLGQVGDELTKLAHAYGEFSLYVGDDERIYA